eukprot:2462333-Prymnesium_polylepis.9
MGTPRPCNPSITSSNLLPVRLLGGGRRVRRCPARCSTTAPSAEPSRSRNAWVELRASGISRQPSSQGSTTIATTLPGSPIAPVPVNSMWAAREDPFAGSACRL